MKTYGGGKVQQGWFLISALNTDEWSCIRSGRFVPGKRASGIVEQEFGWAQCSYESIGGKKNCFPLVGIEPLYFCCPSIGLVAVLQRTRPRLLCIFCFIFVYFVTRAVRMFLYISSLGCWITLVSIRECRGFEMTYECEEQKIAFYWGVSLLVPVCVFSITVTQLLRL
jgi:hypothetical protein